ncbi:MAG: DUF1836 domain-containing protein [Lachnospiraceae bacterium]|nr:DUF1836 domain-containing protein [Lachnospiraceae bacterium]
MADKNSPNIKEVIRECVKLDFIKPEDVPSIELYMDQVTTFMDKELSNTKRFDSDKTLTKTMINNYSKNELLPPPNKKKYSKEHIYLLIYIYYLKNSLSIADIKHTLSPMIDTFCDSNDTSKMDAIYKAICDSSLGKYMDILKDIDNTHNYSKKVFKDFDGEEKEYLDKFAFMASLGYEIYLKKKLLEHMVDTYFVEEEAEKPQKEDKKPKEDKKTKKEKQTKKASKA